MRGSLTELGQLSNVNIPGVRQRVLRAMLTLVEQEFSKQTIANMEIALERACRSLPKRLDEDKTRKAIAGIIVKCAREKTTTLAGMTEAARQAIAFLLAEEPPEASVQSPATE